jgi:hypothetical protein
MLDATTRADWKSREVRQWLNRILNRKVGSQVISFEALLVKPKFALTSDWSQQWEEPRVFPLCIVFHCRGASRPRTFFLSVFRLCIALFICSSMWAITARRPSRRCAANSAGKQCVWVHSSWSTPWVQRRRPTRFPHSYVSTRPACRFVLMPWEI